LNIGQIVQRVKQAFMAVGPYGSSGGLFGNFRETWAGEWSTNTYRPMSQENILAFSAVYACVSLIADDIAKCCINLMSETADGIDVEIDSPAFTPVLRKPNRYQTRIQFMSQWIVSKLLYGNAYIYKERDQRGVVVAMYVLHPARCTPLIAPDGSVYYRLGIDYLAGVESEVDAVPASEIIHDRMICLWHPLIGVSPIYACASSATQGIRIQANSAKFFENMSRPSGMLTTPNKITEEQAATLKARFEAGVSGQNIGRLLVAGDGLAYVPFTMPARDAQLVEQLNWTAKDVCRTFKVPPHKLGLSEPTLTNIGALNQDYYSQTLQIHIESIELLLGEGLGTLGANYEVEFEIDDLQRMDPLSIAETEKAWAGIKAPNESRKRANLAPVAGGDAVYLQQQNYSTEALAKRDAQADPFRTATPTPAKPQPEPAANDAVAEAASAATEMITRACAEFAAIQNQASEKIVASLAQLDAKLDRPEPVAVEPDVVAAKTLADAIVAKFMEAESEYGIS
jgi:HK97 family phage portal protein